MKDLITSYLSSLTNRELVVLGLLTSFVFTTTLGFLFRPYPDK